MKRYVLSVLMWMIVLKVVVVAFYWTGTRPAISVGTSDIPETVTAAVPAELSLSSLMASANAADTLESVGSMEPDVDNTANLNQMAAETQRLAEQKKYLERQEARLLDLKEEISRKIEELTLLREEILATMDRKSEVQESEVRHLIKIYSTMKPQKVAQLIEQLDIDLVTALFSRMKGDVVGDILSFVDAETGARITRGLFPESSAETGMP